MSDVTFSEDGLRAALAPRPVRFYEQVGSSNDVGLEWLGHGADDGAIVVADEQTKGRGRLGRSWYAPPGTALMFSYLLRPDVKTLPRVGMLGALAVCETLEQMGLGAVGIKWPNDVQMGRRKVCGVLPEARWEGSNLVGVVLGIGLNVRVDFTDTPFVGSAVSLEAVLGRSVDRADLLAALLARLDHWRGRLADETLFANWRGRLNMLHEPVAVVNGGMTIEGMAEDIDRDGALLVRGNDGRIQRVMAGDIALG